MTDRNEISQVLNKNPLSVSTFFMYNTSMKNLITILTVGLLTACGGGTGVAPIELQTLTTTGGNPPMGSSPILTTKVIDGYVEGANVFLDVNWNLIQDEGEPSANYNAESQEYYFLESQFTAVDNFSVESCAYNRPRIAEVPIGAYDSTRGYVETAYTMSYYPAAYNDSGRANVTPFTTLFADYVSDALQGVSISVANGCGTVATNTATTVINKVESVLYDLYQNFGVSSEELYSDFIASENTTLQATGERIVDFLGTINTVATLLEDEYNLNILSTLDTGLISTILNGTEFSTITFNLMNETEGEQVDDNFRYQRRHAFYNLVANHQGQILDNDGNPIVLTTAGLSEVADTSISENYESITNVFGLPVIIAIEITNGVSDSYIRFLSDVGHLSYTVRGDMRWVQEIVTPNVSDFELRINNTNNTNFSYDLLGMMSYRDVYTIQDIYTEINALSKTMSNYVSLTYLLSDGDMIQYYENEHAYTNGPTKTEQCDVFVGNSSTSYFGNEAYNICSSNMQ